MNLIDRNTRPTHRSRRLGVKSTSQVLIGAVLTGLMMGALTAPAEAGLTQVCRVKVTFELGGDDLRGNTRVQIAAGGQSFTVPGGIGGGTTQSRTGAFPRCIPHSALTNGFMITSISNPSWPEGTDNWNMDGISVMDPDTGREYFRRSATRGIYIHRFKANPDPSERPSGPTWSTGAIHISERAPFLDRRYASCPGDQMFVRFVDPLRPRSPIFTVTMHRPGTPYTVEGRFWGPPDNDWGGSLAGLHITRANEAYVEFRGRTPDGRTAAGVISPGCNPVKL